MMKIHLRFLAVLTALLLTVALSSCSKARGSALMSSADGEWSGAGFNPESPAPSEGETAPAFKEMSRLAKSSVQDDSSARDEVAAIPSKPNAERKLVRRADFSIQIKDAALAEQKVLELVGKLGGYVASTEASTSGLSMELRVPRTAFDAAVGSLSALGDVQNRSVSSEDVTVHFYDLEGQLETKKQLRETFRGYLKTARSVEDILAVETRLSELQSEIDRLGGSFRELSDLVDYATISLRLNLPSSVVDTYEPGLGEKLASLFGGFGGFLKGLTVVLVGIVIYGIPALAFLAFLWWLLLGKIGLLRKLFRLVNGKKNT